MDDIALNQIRNAATTNIVELIEEVVELKNYGRDRYKGCCPFHGEDTPSFTVDNGKYYCFGCGKGGDAIKFVRQIKGLSFGEAVKYLGDRYGIQSDGGTLHRFVSRPRLRPIQGIKQPSGYVAPRGISRAVYDPYVAGLLDELRTDDYDRLLGFGIVPTDLILELKRDVGMSNL